MALVFGVRSNLLSHPDPVPIGSVMVFHQDAAPDGWVKDVASTLDNAALRIVTSTAWASGKSGATAFSSVFGSSKSSANYTLLDPTDIPSHQHDVTGSTGGAGGTLRITSRFDSSSGGDVTNAAVARGSDGAHQHGLVLDLHHVNFIICTKE